MKKGTASLLAALILGLIGGVIRAYELMYAFDHDTQLLVHWSPLTIALGALTLAAALCVGLFARGAAPSEPGKAAPSAVWKLAMLLATAFLIASLVFDALSLAENFAMSRLMYILLTILACVGLGGIYASSSRRKFSPTTGFYFTIVVFWCCYTLVLDFWEHAANPVLLSFLYTMFTLIFLTLSVFSVAGFFFDRRNVRRSLFYSGIGVYFSLLSLLAFGLYSLLNQSSAVLQTAEPSWATLCRLAFAFLFMTCLSIGVGSGLYTPMDFAKPAQALSPSDDEGEEAAAAPALPDEDQTEKSPDNDESSGGPAPA